jgi:arginine decarboxylase
MVDRDTLIPLISIGDTDATVEHLVSSLLRSLQRRRGRPREVAASTAWSIEPQVAMTPRDAFFAPRERVSAERAVGRVAAEMAAPYPPGIPVIAPGEVIDAELLAAVRAEARAGSRIAYVSDHTLDTLLVVADR